MGKKGKNEVVNLDEANLIKMVGGAIKKYISGIESNSAGERVLKLLRRRTHSVL